jgi:chemotaxis protein methyltransferase CheR
MAARHPRLDVHVAEQSPWSIVRSAHPNSPASIPRENHDQNSNTSDFLSNLLEADPREWLVLDECCHITISRFFRDRAVFEFLRQRVLPDIAERANKEGRVARCWSAGCASGEEPYTLKIIWNLEAARDLPDDGLTVIATDADETMLSRARKGCFEAASLRELPPLFVADAFDRTTDGFCVQARHREGITFLSQDLRLEAPPGPFDLVLCRYVAFTYFAPQPQRQALTRLVDRLLPGGYLVIGTHERLPEGESRLIQQEGVPQVFRWTDNRGGP